MFPDNVLIDIFDFFRKSHYHIVCLSWKWHILVHVCQRWRRIVFASPRRLGLRICCTNGTPVRKNLDIWPAFPIVIDYDKRITLSDEDNVIAALEHPDRVCYIWLGLGTYITGSLLGKMATVMQESFPALTHLHIPSDHGNVPVLSDRFLGGSAPCLQEIELWVIPFPALPNLLLSSRGLVRLTLHDIPQNGYISPEAMVEILATLTSLEGLGIYFRSPVSRPDRILPPVTRTVLPVLTSLSFFGDHEYLEYLAACINAPRLDTMLILYLNPVIDFQIPQLCEFINRADITKRSPPRRCHVTLQRNYISLNLDAIIDRGEAYGVPPGEIWGTSPHIDVSFNCDGQVSLITQVQSRISSLLSNVFHLVIHWAGPPDQWEDMDDIEWLQLLLPYTAVRTLFVSTELAGHVARALEDVEMATEVLPALELLCLEDLPGSSIAEFFMARRLSGCPVRFVSTSRGFGKRLNSYPGAA
jgi:hypothetical protein